MKEVERARATDVRELKSVELRNRFRTACLRHKSCVAAPIFFFLTAEVGSGNEIHSEDCY